MKDLKILRLAFLKAGIFLMISLFFIFSISSAQWDIFQWHEATRMIFGIIMSAYTIITIWIYLLKKFEILKFYS